MGVAFGGVEKEVAHSSARDVLVLLGNVGENNAVGNIRARPHVGGLFEVGLSKIWESEEP